MEAKEKKVELLQIAIKQLIDEEKANKTPSSSSSDDGFLAVSTAGDDSGHHHHLLSKLLSQLETLKEDEAVVVAEDCTAAVTAAVAEDQGSSSPETEKEDIVKELKKLRRQNFITHCLLSAMIVLTVAWQVSEVSLILKVKNGLSNPLKILGGGFLSKFLKLPKSDDHHEHHDGKNHGSAAASAPQNPLLTTSTVPGLRIPDLPHVEFPNFDLVHEEDW